MFSNKINFYYARSIWYNYILFYILVNILYYIK